jgi:hypothetical protein
VTTVVDHSFNSQAGFIRGQPLRRRNQSFMNFVSRVLANANTPISTVLITLVYIQRSKPYILIALEDWACERVFLGALVVAAKYSNDAAFKNKHWAQCTEVFSTADVSQIEREYLGLMAFELYITQVELLPLISDILTRSRDVIKNRHKQRLSPMYLKPKPFLQRDADAVVAARRLAYKASQVVCDGEADLQPCSPLSFGANTTSTSTVPPPMAATVPIQSNGIPYLPSEDSSDVGSDCTRSSVRRTQLASSCQSRCSLPSVKTASYSSRPLRLAPARSPAHSGPF